MAGGAGGSGVVVLAQDPLAVLHDVHGIAAFPPLRRVKGNAMFGFFINFLLGMVGTQMAFTAVFRLSGHGWP